MYVSRKRPEETEMISRNQPHPQTEMVVVEIKESRGVNFKHFQCPCCKQMSYRPACVVDRSFCHGTGRRIISHPQA
jgi:hypothetical protein